MREVQKGKKYKHIRCLDTYILVNEVSDHGKSLMLLVEWWNLGQDGTPYFMTTGVARIVEEQYDNWIELS